MAEVLGSLSFLDTPDVNGDLVLTATTGVNSLSGTANQISVTGSLPTYTVGLADNPIIPGTDSLIVPSGTTAQRSGSPAAGMIRFNSTIGSLETYDTPNWISLSGVIDKSVITQTVTAAAATSIMTYSVPGGTMGTDGILRITLQGSWANASGANRTATIAVSYGATTLWTDTTGNLTTGTITGWNIDLMLQANNSASAQVLSGRALFGPTGIPTTGATGNFGTAWIGAALINGSSAINSAVANNLTVTITLSGTGTTWIKQFHILEKL